MRHQLPFRPVPGVICRNGSAVAVDVERLRPLPADGTWDAIMTRLLAEADASGLID
jgi:hypothetical protein